MSEDKSVLLRSFCYDEEHYCNNLRKKLKWYAGAGKTGFFSPHIASDFDHKDTVFLCSATFLIGSEMSRKTLCKTS